MSLRGQTKAIHTAEALARLLVVASGPVNVGLSAPVVEGILPAEEAGTQEVLTIRGTRYRVAPLTRRWGEAPPAGAPQARVILCGSRGRHRAFRVDRVLGMADVAPELLRELPPHFACEERGWFKGFFLFRDTIALWANPDWLVAPEEGEEVEPSVDPGRLIVEAPSLSGATVEMEIVDAEGAE